MEDGRCKLGLLGRLELVRLIETGATLRPPPRRLSASRPRRGPLADQAGLHGILDQLHELGIEVVEVRRLPGDS
jgi:hypothetical protein